MGIFHDASYYGRLLKELVFPRRCAVCGQNINVGFFCSSCRKHYLLAKQLEYAPPEQLPDMSHNAEPLLPEDVLDGVIMLYKYDDALKDALHQIKFGGDARLLPLLREEAEDALPSGKLLWLDGFDFITWIPTSAERLAKRGFDVPDELFGALLDERGHSTYRGGILERVRRTEPLFELKPEERRAELDGCFALGKNADVRGKSVLLCDDIYTTGSTFVEAAAVLRRAGARRIVALAFSAARSHW